MADQKQKKKRPSRRAYLNDFVQNANGQYIYTGKVFTFEGASYSRYCAQLVLAACGMLGATIAAECLPAVEASRFTLAVLTWLGQMICACLTAWAVLRMLAGRSPLRAYIHKASVDKLSLRSLVGAVFAFANAAVLIVTILVRGTDPSPAASWLRPVLAAVSGISALFIHHIDHRSVWRSS